MTETHHEPGGGHDGGHPDTEVADEHGMSHAIAGPHGATTDHGEEHGHDDHAHGGDRLGPIDWTMWGVGVLSVIVGLVVAAAFAVGSAFTPAG